MFDYIGGNVWAQSFEETISISAILNSDLDVGLFKITDT